MLLPRITFFLALSLGLNIALACGELGVFSTDSDLANKGEMIPLTLQDGELCYNQADCVTQARFRRRDGEEYMQVRFRRRGKNDSPPSVLELDVSSDVNFCYFSLDQVVLWRPDAGQRASLTVKDQFTQEKLVTIRFRRNANTKEWPKSGLDLVAGTYLIEMGDVSRKLTLHQLPPNVPPNETDVIAWMKQQGCTTQLEILGLDQKYRRELREELQKLPQSRTQPI